LFTCFAKTLEYELHTAYKDHARHWRGMVNPYPIVTALHRTLLQVSPVRRGLGLERALAPYILGLWLLSREDHTIRRAACDLIKTTLTHGGETPRYRAPRLTHRALDEWRNDLIDRRMREDRERLGGLLNSLPPALRDSPRDQLEALEAECGPALFTMKFDGLSAVDHAILRVLEAATDLLNSNEIAALINEEGEIATEADGNYVRKRISRLNRSMGHPVILSVGGSNNAGYWLAYRPLPAASH